MRQQFEARIVQIQLCESDKWRGKPLHEAIVAKCQELGLAGATVYRGIEGYGTSAKIHHESLWRISRDAPIMLSVIDREEQIAKLLPHLDTMVEEGLITVAPVEVIRLSRSPADEAA